MLQKKFEGFIMKVTQMRILVGGPVGAARGVFTARLKYHLVNPGET